MGIQVTLLDKSVIIQKMLTHCLYYFAAEVQRFDNFEDSRDHIIDKKSDIVFVDWDLKQGATPVIHSVVKEVTSVPVVLLYRAMNDMEIKSLPPDYVSHKIQKPLDPKTFRDTFTQLVPKARDSVLHKFLKFPKTTPPPPQDDAQDQPNPLLSAAEEQKTAHSENLIPIPKKDPAATDEALKIEISQQMSPSKKPSLKIKLPSEQTASHKETPEKPISQKDLNQNISLTAIRKATQKKEEKPTSLSSSPSPKKGFIKKEDIDIDENTQNDLAPMTIKSSSSIQENFIDHKIELSEKDILKVLNKYKDTLEFQNSIEKFLSSYAKDTAKKILQEDKITKEVLQQSLDNFKNSQKFKHLVEEQINEYVQKHLPLVIKSIVKQKIDKIIGEI